MKSIQSVRMAQQYVAAKEAFERLTQMMSTRVSIPVSSRYNAIYDEADLHRSLIALSIGNGYAESGMRRLAIEASSTRVPSGSWVRDAVARLSEKDATERLERALDSTLEELKRFGVFSGPVMAGLDKHQIPRHDQRMEPFITRGKRKAGTTRFETYATLQCVEEGTRAQLACAHFEALDDNADVVGSLLERARLQEVEVSLLFMDREFFSASCIARLDMMGQRYLMPCRRTSGIKAAIMEHAHGKRRRVSRYVLKHTEGETASFNLVILPRKGCEKEDDPLKRYIAFATNIPRRFVMWNVKMLPDDYRRRWGIESGYAGVEKLRARTTSRNHSLRLLYFFYALVIYNSWLLANLVIAKRFSKPLTRPIIERVMVEAAFHRLVVESFAGGG